MITGYVTLLLFNTSGINTLSSAFSKPANDTTLAAWTLSELTNDIIAIMIIIIILHFK